MICILHCVSDLLMVNGDSRSRVFPLVSRTSYLLFSVPQGFSPVENRGSC